MNIGLGYVNPSYQSNSAIQSLVSLAQSLGAKSSALGFDTGIYRRVGSHLFLGLGDTFFTDTYGSSGSLDLRATALVFDDDFSVSLQYFPFTQNASWLFLRVDTGLAVGFVGNGAASTVTETGVGLHGGAGIAFPFKRVRFPLLASYSVESVGGGALTAYGVTFSVMWVW
jgi:hypothetical protein